MKAFEVDPKARSARAEPGVTWGEFNEATQAHGLATTGGVVSSTGIAGLTLGGGIGYLMGKYGLAVDNLLSVEVVTADGRALTASEEENTDLFWAICGGGGNFGVVSSFKYRLHPVGPQVTGGLIAYPFEAARDVLRFYRDATASAPDELTLFAGLVGAPDRSGARLAAIVVCHCGPLGEAKSALSSIKSFATPALDAIAPVGYCEMNTLLDDALPRGALNYWKSSFLGELSDDAIDAMVECYASCPSPMGQLLLEHIHGEATRVPVDATAFPHRAEGYNMLVLSQWMSPADTDRCFAWGRESYGALAPFRADARYMNYMNYMNYMDHDDADQDALAYGSNYRRLQEIKREVRSRERLPREPEHPAAGLSFQPPPLPPRSPSRSRPARWTTSKWTTWSSRSMRKRSSSG